MGCCIMVLFKNATLYVAKETVVKNAEGTKIKKFDFDAPLESFRADVQPNTLSQMQIDLYGINSKTAQTKKCFYEKANYMTNGNRVKVVDDNGKIGFYNIQPINEWRTHSEVLLIPVENE